MFHPHCFGWVLIVLDHLYCSYYRDFRKKDSLHGYKRQDVICSLFFSFYPLLFSLCFLTLLTPCFWLLYVSFLTDILNLCNAYCERRKTFHQAIWNLVYQIIYFWRIYDYHRNNFHLQRMYLMDYCLWKTVFRAKIKCKLKSNQIQLNQRLMHVTQESFPSFSWFYVCVLLTMSKQLFS